MSVGSLASDTLDGLVEIIEGAFRQRAVQCLDVGSTQRSELGGIFAKSVCLCLRMLLRIGEKQDRLLKVDLVRSRPSGSQSLHDRF